MSKVFSVFNLKYQFNRVKKSTVFTARLNKLMQKKVNTILFKNLLETEFLLLSSQINSNARKFDLAVDLNRLDNKTTLSLDIFELAKTLKQLVRILQFLVKLRRKKLSICSSTKYTVSFLELYRKEFILNNIVQLESESSRIKKYSKGVQGLILIEEPLKNKISAFKKFIEQDIFLINKINSIPEYDHSGTYKIYNDVSDFKKLAFLIALINNVLKK